LEKVKKFTFATKLLIMKKWIMISLIIAGSKCLLFGQQDNIIKTIDTGKDFSIRGLSIASPSSVWISGSSGQVAISKDGGKTYNFSMMNNYNNLDFRDIYAFNDSEALILNSGTPSYILKTADGGKNWKEVYKNTAKEIFFDGFDFWDKQHGIAFGDPLKGRLFILTTNDGGDTWQEPDSMFIPDCDEGEAGFAASGSSICCGKKGRVIIGTGGSHARLFISDDYGIHWRTSVTPMVSGKESQGIFSIAIDDNNDIFIAGGDYKNKEESQSSFYFTDDEGITWHKPETGPAGYRSSLWLGENNLMFTTGTGGSNISEDAGRSWKTLTGDGFNIVAGCKACGFVIFAGSKGKTGLLKIQTH
jgi:photosystem II stability/assembly factor-like uncharacterized protein